MLDELRPASVITGGAVNEEQEAIGLGTGWSQPVGKLQAVSR